MSVERVAREAVGNEPTLATAEVTDQMRLQILSTEHWSLLASRNLAWNESFTRAGMFLSTLSFSIVALALVGQAAGFDEGFRLFALIVLPVVLFVGMGTMVRLDSANHHDAVCVIGMNRIRAAYMELAPDLKRFFVMGTTDDMRGVTTTMSPAPNQAFMTNFVAATPTLVAVLNSMLVAAIAALVLVQLGTDTVPALVVGAVGFVATFCLWMVWTRRHLLEQMKDYRPMFPSDDAD
jgi:hypothetical protein